MGVSEIKGRLGFGCSGLMGGISKDQSCRLLECAYDSGIRHFDVARSYGYGQAEKVLGEFLRGKRSSVSITTKIGIKPVMVSGSLNVLRTLARKVVGLVPASRSVFRRSAAALVRKAPITSELVTTSLQESLASLRTEYVDILLLHECSPAELADGTVFGALQDLRRRGLIRAFGLGSEINVTEQVVRSFPGSMPVVQVENNPFTRVFERITLDQSSFVITHRPLGQHFASVCAVLREDRDLAKKCSEVAGFDVTDVRALGRGLLAYALESNPLGGVLFSSRNPAHILGNAELLRSGTLRNTVDRRMEDFAAVLGSRFNYSSALQDRKA